ncbi:MAG: ABC transporter ATP-binding protein [Bifidobacteriaceae bacterium]|jgi:iron complex transport system ATP-binding protein|nr:ABC transporter ATP-binding protein [Bifidobacteriaceae bacterium]
MSLDAIGLAWSAGGRRILRGIDLHVAPGEFLGLVGPNGSGKSSLLRLIAGLCQPEAGQVLVNGVDLATNSARARAKLLALMRQENAPEAELTVMEVALLGRVPHNGPFRPPGARERDLARRALALFGVAELAGRRWPTLSGGERQRVLLARAVTQETSLLLLDEFTNHLDVRHQMRALALFAETDCTVVAALHNLDQAAAHCDQVVLLSDGRVVSAGPPAEVLTADAIQEVYGTPAAVTLGGDGRPIIRFKRLEPALKEFQQIKRGEPRQ